MASRLRTKFNPLNDRARYALVGLALLLGSPATVAQVADLAWLAGHWSDGRTEEIWLPPQTNQMLGLNRSLGKSAAFEYLRIAEQDGVPCYLASPGGREATAFCLTEQAPRRVVFENPKHDFPQRIVYQRSGRQMRVWAQSLDGQQSLHWEWDLISVIVGQGAPQRP